MVRRLKLKRGFTLIELLAVVGIIAILAVAVVPGMRGVGESFSLTSATDQVVSTFNLARQTAMARNTPVEVRLYRLPSATGTGSGEYRLVGAVIPHPTDSSRDEWILKLRPLPNGIIFDDGSVNAEFSSLIRGAGTGSTAVPRRFTGVATGVPMMVRDREYVAFTIRADGSTNLDPAASTPWTVSLRTNRDRPVADRPANNFVTVLIDPVLGRPKVFRP